MIRVTHFMRAPGPRNHSIERLYQDIRDHLPSDVRAAVRTNDFQSIGLLRRLKDALAARRYQADINHVTGDTHYLVYFLDKCRTILTIHDCVPLESRSGFRRWALWFFWYWLAERRSNLIITVSHATRTQLLKHLSCDPAKIVVIHNCVSDEFKPSPRAFDVASVRFLQVGTNENKNLERTAEAIRGIPCVLVIIGLLSRAQIDFLESRSIQYENHVGLTRNELIDQYRQCDVLLFASTYEGFGLPILEAQAIGRPVVTSNVWSMPEVAAEAACLIDPYDVESIRLGILKLLNDAQYRTRLVELGFENVKRFTAESVAAKYAEQYRRLFDDASKHEAMRSRPKANERLHAPTLYTAPAADTLGAGGRANEARKVSRDDK